MAYLPSPSSTSEEEQAAVLARAAAVELAEAVLVEAEARYVRRPLHRLRGS